MTEWRNSDTLDDVDLSSPLRSVAPGLDSAVLEVLARTESGLSATQIARLAGRGSRAGQRDVLNRLVEHGLVLAEPANRGYLYRLNRSHVLADPLLAVARSRSTILDRLKQASQTLQPSPLHVSVFGSFARGEGGPASDIDLLLVTSADLSGDETWVDQVQALADSVVAWTGNRLEHIVLTLNGLHSAVDSSEPIVASWLDDSYTLLGPPITLLIKERHAKPRHAVAGR